MFVAILLIIQMYTLSLCRRLNLTFQTSQGTANTYFRWSGHSRVSFVKGLFQDNSSNFYWNQFIFDRQGAKYKLAQFFWDTVQNMHRLTESVCRLDATLLGWRLWRHCSQKSAATWRLNAKRLPSIYTVASVSCWSIVHRSCYSKECYISLV